MPVSALSAARTLCEARNWRISNLELQKLLYIAEMYLLGLTGHSLINEDFEAWDYGPVVPEVYSRARGFGKGPVPNVFHWVPPIPANSPERSFLFDLAAQTKKFSAGQLVNITHWPGGAWAAHYRPGEHGIKIPKIDILKEYRDRERARQRTNAAAR
jgi:uncharacterized phage-associated protein